ncbi:hypothetical protein IBT49_26770 [Erwinia sp. S63]|uniref:hypothetical protein n=1 Tax=Erwinia sp. S63 TaxID=2769341 RepID=UPI00190DBB75|nr:hypothetical protein [Erwinia sp. S63]MBK0099599.1 hypothetical protein [Erwinia sp. S63]
MATGDSEDMHGRLRKLIPPGWFSEDSPFLNAALEQCAAGLSWCYALYGYARKQTRLLTASNGWLDLIAYDFFGHQMRRWTGEKDDLYRRRVHTRLFRECGTRQAVTDVLTDLTGQVPDVFEPQRPLDTGGYNMPANGYGQAGRYGSVMLPYQAFIQVTMPALEIHSSIAGYHCSPSGYSSKAWGAYLCADEVDRGLRSYGVQEAITSVKPEGTIIWLRLQ